MQGIGIIAPGVHALLSNINPPKDAGLDDIPACVLKETAHVITPVSTHLIKQSLDSGRYHRGRNHAVYMILGYEKRKSFTHTIIV